MNPDEAHISSKILLLEPIIRTTFGIDLVLVFVRFINLTLIPHETQLIHHTPCTAQGGASQ